MNCSPTICIALLLLSLTAGMWLLAKTRQETLGTFFKVVAWFIIIVSICSMIHCSVHCIMMRCCMKSNECAGMEECGPGHFNKRVMMFKGHGGGCEMEMKCCKGEKEGCEEGEEACGEKQEGCCKGKGGEGHEMNVEVKIDTVAKKK